MVGAMLVHWDSHSQVPEPRLEQQGVIVSLIWRPKSKTKVSVPSEVSLRGLSMAVFFSHGFLCVSVSSTPLLRGTPIVFD